MQTIGKCSRCGKPHPVEELMLLPEAEAYERAFSKSLISGVPAPPPLDEDILRKKYGYDSTSVFCEDCLAALLLGKD